MTNQLYPSMRNMSVAKTRDRNKIELKARAKNLNIILFQIRIMFCFTFLSCLGGADTLFPFRKLPNKVDKKLLEEEIEEDDVSWVWFELVVVGSADEGRDEGQKLCLSCWNLEVLRGLETELAIWELELFPVICIGVVLGGL